jgi:predicted permease
MLRTDRRERDMDEEMRLHLDLEARELTREGMSPEAAQRQARLLFGGIERYKEEARDALGVRLVEDLAQDVRYAARQCLASPSFTLLTVLTLGLGIGASTVMYAFAQLNPVPFENADRLVSIRQYSVTGCPGCRDVASGNALVFASSSRTLESVALMSQGASDAVFRATDRSELVRAVRVTHEFFPTVGVKLVLGRGFLPLDTLPEQPPVAVISEGMWRTRFGADPSIIGQDIVLDGKHHTVRGVLPGRYEYPERTDIWTLQRLTAAEANEHGASFHFQTIGRLREGISVERADAEAREIGARIALAYPADFSEWTLGVRPLRNYNGYGDDTTTAIFFAAVALVLLVSCTNLAGLLIARLTRRRRELAVRVAIGAHTSRIARQLLTETLLICVLAGAVGAVMARFGLTAVTSALPDSAAPAGWTRLGLDWRAFAFALSLGSLAGFAIGLWPSVRFARPELQVELRDGVRNRSTSGASGGERVRRGLVVLEIALSLVLVAAASLLVRSIANLARAPVGFSSDHVMTMNLRLPAEMDGTRVESPGYFDRLAAEVARIPGVTSAGAVAFLPLNRVGWSALMFQVAGRPPLTGSGGTRTQFATPGYFETLKIPILRGRAFTEADASSASVVALVNESLARRFFPDEDPIGRVLVLHDGRRLTVQGIVGDVKHQGAGNRAGAEIIIPAATVTRRSMYLVARTRGEPSELASQIVKTIGRFDQNVAISRVQTMDAVVRDFLGPFRVMLMIMGGFAAIALVIAMMGLYAIVSFGVASRTREFGVRMALGGTGTHLLALVLGQAMRLTGVGVMAGVAGALAATRVMRSMLFGVRPGDPLTVGIAGMAICAIAILSALLPALRALRVDPVRSLRAE